MAEEDYIPDNNMAQQPIISTAEYTELKSFRFFTKKISKEEWGLVK